MQVVVLYNRPVLPSTHLEYDSDEAVATTVDDVCDILAAGGFAITRLGGERDLQSMEMKLRECQPDVVFNLFEGFADQPESEITVAQILERLRVPFTGSCSRSLSLALDKHLAKQSLLAAGLPMPWSFIATTLPLPVLDVPWAVIVKPARRDASEGIDQGSVVTTWRTLESRVGYLLQRYASPVLIEQFLPGREFTVSLLETPELVALPIAEVQYSPTETCEWPILTYAAKWLPGSREYAASAMVHGADLPVPLSRRLTTLAMGAYRALECRDYARIDLRLDGAGEPSILEVNANPDLSPTACFAGALSAAGLDRGIVMEGLVRQAAGRENTDRKSRVSQETSVLTSGG